MKTKTKSLLYIGAKRAVFLGARWKNLSSGHIISLNGPACEVKQSLILFSQA